MSYDLYESRLTQIDQIGNDAEEFDPFNTDYYLNEARSSALNDDDGQYGEREIAIAKYGPFTFTDSGSVQFSLRSMLHLGSSDFSRVHLDPESDKDAKPEPALFSGDTVELKPRVRLKVDPLRSLRGDPEESLRSYGGSLEVKFYSDILRKKLFAGSRGHGS